MQRDKEKEPAKPSTPGVQMIDMSSHRRDADLIFRLKSNELHLKAEIAKLKRELDRNNQTWEKKFEILKQQLHSIKDEMYLRQTLRKQTTNSKLSYASVAYTVIFISLKVVLELTKVYSNKLKIKMSQPPQFPPLQETFTANLNDSVNSNGKPVLVSQKFVQTT
jgi:hypothetical protein